MKLNKILAGINYELIKGSTDIDIKDLSNDSRKIKENFLFVATSGYEDDGHNYINNAISNGATAIIISKNITVESDICIIKVPNTNKIMSKLSMNFFDNPQDKLIKIGITGTKGKTTVTFMIKKILESSNIECGLIGTTGIYIKDKYYKSINTTPSIYEIIKYMDEMVKQKIKYIVMEVSSQALKYDRVNDIIFDYGLYTNLTSDHIGPGEHSSMEDYISSKAKLFKQSKIGILNIDDKYYPQIIENSTCKIYTYGCYKSSSLTIEKIDLLKDENFIGINLTTSGIIKDNFKISMPGKFTAYNASLAILTTFLMGINIKYIKESLKKFSVRGRVENIEISSKFKLIIDYAHNGISTKSILETIKEYNPKRIVTIFGCGGNRSRDRRYEMGYMAGLYSDFCIITEDNNRYEEFENIVADIQIGIDKTNCKYVIIPDRKEAIRKAIKEAEEGDIIMLLGKGHEDYKEVKGVRYPFDERKIIQEILVEENL